ncbi:MAG: methionine--tRNA ligase [Aquificaceae bacterium]
MFLVTTPIYYVNDEPHIGHFYTTLAADVLARYHRALGEKVFFLTGTDEHGLKMQKAAQERGLDPKELADKNAGIFKSLWDELGISYDRFIRTTEKDHIELVKEVFTKCKENGFIYKGEYSGWYCVGCEEFKPESELLEGNACPIHLKPCEYISEPTYFFRLSAFGDFLKDFLNSNAVMPKERVKEMLSFIQEGLKDLSVTRPRSRVSWGIPVPFDKDHTIYVWFDALFNYVSGLPSWPASLHLVGKDILRFHSLYWPSFLNSIGFQLPQRIFAHGWWKVEGQKMSKSLGNVLKPLDLVRDFGLDEIRYFLLREIPFGDDGDISKDAILRRINAELSNNVGNLYSRVVGIATKFGKSSITGVKDINYCQRAEEFVKSYHDKMANVDFYGALEEVMSFCMFLNKYVDTKAPWALSDEDAILNTLYALFDGICLVCSSLEPFMPNKMRVALSAIGVEEPIFAPCEKPSYRVINKLTLFPRRA